MAFSFQCCFVAANGYDSERQKGSKEMVVELPGTSLSLKVDGEIRFSAPEGIFKPSLWGKESAGLHQLVCFFYLFEYSQHSGTRSDSKMPNRQSTTSL